MTALGQWQPIETAPKDETEILVSGLDGGDGPIRHYAVVSWRGGWEDTGDSACGFSYLTHWMPLPPFPADAS